MGNTLQQITLSGLALSFIPALLVVFILFRWSIGGRPSLHALARMALQLILVGYVLTFIFQTDRIWVVLGVLTIMLSMASWIALRPLQRRSPALLANAWLAILLGGGLSLVVVTQVVLNLEPWYYARYMVPLAGMAFSNAMNAVSLAAERLNTELDHGASAVDARNTAVKTSLIPMVNSLFATGLVSVPGMMTGQILAGVSPLLAARYQMVIMTMVFGSAGLASITYVSLVGRTNRALQNTSAS
jgi:putative ABC transport system permease protein